jgi:hypothetical protein
LINTVLGTGAVSCISDHLEWIMVNQVIQEWLEEALVAFAEMARGNPLR